MRPFVLTQKRLRELRPCYLSAHLERFGDKPSMGVRTALAAGFTVEQVGWAAARHSWEAHRRMVGFAIDCAQRVVYMNANPRPRAPYLQRSLDATRQCFVHDPCSEDIAWHASQMAADAYRGASVDMDMAMITAQPMARGTLIQNALEAVMSAATAATELRGDKGLPSSLWHCSSTDFITMEVRRAARAYDSLSERASGKRTTAREREEETYQEGRLIYWLTEERPCLALVRRRYTVLEDVVTPYLMRKPQ